MRKKISIIAFSSAILCSGGLGLTSCGAQANNDAQPRGPVTKEKRQMNPKVPNITVGDFRLQILDKSTVRFEYKYQNPIFGTYDWLDDDTFFVPNRTLYQGIDNYTKTEDNTNVIVEFENIKIVIPKNIKVEDNFKGIKIYQKNGDTLELIYDADDTEHFNQSLNTGELPEPASTPKAFELIDYPRIIEPPFGYSTANLLIEPYRSHLDAFGPTCGFEIQKHRDIYVTFPNKNPKALRQQYRNLAGAPEFVKLSTLGAWDSRYYPYTEKSAQQEIDKYYENNLPLDNIVIDTNWRASFDGKGYFINEELFPDMPRFLDSVHAQNINVCFNDHPEPQKEDKKELDVLNKKEVDFRNTNLKKIMNMGLDMWWYDRNWSTSLICPGGKSEEHEQWLNHETWGDYLYNNVARQLHMENAEKYLKKYGKYLYERPLAMSNVVHIQDGKWNTDGRYGEKGITDSMSHRYSIQWTGDQNSTMLPTEVNNVVKTGIRGIPYMSSDIGGYNNPAPSDYYYQKWFQFGALSPIFRIHSARRLSKQNQPWLRSQEIIDSFRDYVNMRYHLLPLFYSLAHESYENCMPMCRALSFEYPDDPIAKGMENEYLLGKNILFAPCVENASSKTTELTGQWTHKVGDEEKTGAKVEWFKNSNPDTTPEVQTVVDSVNIPNTIDLAKKTIEQTKNFSMRFSGQLKPGASGNLVLNAEGGIRAKIKDSESAEWQTFDDWGSHGARDHITAFNLDSTKTYDVIIEYCNENRTTGSMCLKTQDPISPKTSETKKVYLPKGKWIDLFHGGNVINSNGQWTDPIEFRVNENAIFIKAGSMTPLINHAHNTKELDWTNLAYDVYPTKDKTVDSGTLYEDDFETVAYMSDLYHKSNYSCYYDESTGEYVIKLSPSVGQYIGDDLIANRSYKIRFHHNNLFPDVHTVTLDGNPVSCQSLPVDSQIKVPFNFDGPSRIDDITEITIPLGSIRIGHEIRIK